MEQRRIQVRTFPSTITNGDLEDFLNTVDTVSVYTTMRSAIVHKKGVRTADHADAILFEGSYPSASGGRAEDQAPIYGTRIHVVYREKEGKQ